MAAQSEADPLVRVHERLDELITQVADVRADLRGYAAVCETCQPVVMGNGSQPLDRRVTRLETTRTLVGHAMTVGTSCVVAIIVAIITVRMGGP